MVASPIQMLRTKILKMTGVETFFTISVDITKTTFMHVLIIADNDHRLEWIKSPLQATGLSINVIYAYSISEAMSLLRSVKFDMILYDLSFTEKGMGENFKRLQASGSKAPLVVLTETYGDPEAAQAIQFGAATHIVKDRQRVSVMAESFKNILLQRDLVYN